VRRLFWRRKFGNTSKNQSEFRSGFLGGVDFAFPHLLATFLDLFKQNQSLDKVLQRKLLGQLVSGFGQNGFFIGVLRLRFSKLPKPV